MPNLKAKGKRSKRDRLPKESITSAAQTGSLHVSLSAMADWTRREVSPQKHHQQVRIKKPTL